MAEMQQYSWTQELGKYEGQEIKVHLQFITVPMDCELAHQLANIIQDAITDWPDYSGGDNDR